MTFSIVICTHNRNDILQHCLESIVTFGDIPKQYEVVVIDNGSSDTTSEVVNSFKTSISNLKYIYEPQLGLSYARNRGATESKSEWLFYLDDDAKIKDDSLQEILKLISLKQYELVTGVYIPWYLDEKPKWLPKEFGQYKIDEEEGISDLGSNFVTGNVMLIKKSALIKIGYFPVNFGMKGNSVAYGEDTFVENYFKNNNIPIGINRNLIIDHLVGLSKLKISWHFRSNYAKGRDGIRIINETSIFDFLKRLLIFLFFTLILPFQNFLKFWIHTDYSYSNYIYDTFCPIFALMGNVIGSLGLLLKKLSFWKI